MTVKTPLSSADCHHRFLTDQVGKGIFASTSAGVATPRSACRDEDESFAGVFVEIGSAGER